jgi:hypothetical protein
VIVSKAKVKGIYALLMYIVESEHRENFASNSVTEEEITDQ